MSQPSLPPPRPARKRPYGKLAAIIGLVAILGVACVAVLSADPSTGSRPADRSASATETALIARNPTIRPSYPATPGTTVAPPLAKKLTAREWRLIAKDPDAHVGKGIVVYGEVTQFDAATGGNGFRANVDGVEHKPKYGYVDYPTNTILGGTTTALKDLVEGDLFRAEVVVDGAQSYDTQIGGTTTAPRLAVKKIDVIGSTDR